MTEPNILAEAAERVAKTGQPVALSVSADRTLSVTVNRKPAMEALGTKSDKFAGWALEGLVDTMGDPANEADALALIGAIGEMAPADPLEAMLLTQMVLCHEAILKALKRTRDAQHLDKLNLYAKQANAFMRTYAAQMDALKRYRSKGEQTVKVQHVHVNEGGQAIVGAVTHAPAAALPGGVGVEPEKTPQPHGVPRLVA